MSSKRHSRHWNVSTQEYRWHLGRRLAKEMTAKTRIYVDTCHWVKMRDFELHRPVPPAYGEILAHLRRLVATGRYICPLSPALLLELQTQTDLNTRLHTARLMEELSHSIGLPHLDEMEKLELRRHAFDAFFRTGIQNTDWQVWTKAGFLFGERWAAPPHWIDDQTEIWGLQKQCLDSMWEAPLTQVMEVLADPLDTKDLRDHFATVMNTDRDARPATDFEFERRLALAMVIQQIVIPAAKEIAAECEAIAKNRPDFQMPTIQEKEARDPKCIPSVQILAGIEACIRTTGRKFRDNDMFDLLHCAAAIPYCQVFFCDNAFKALIIDPKLRYDVEYGIEVRSQPEEIAAFLSDLR